MCTISYNHTHNNITCKITVILFGLFCFMVYPHRLWFDCVKAAISEGSPIHSSVNEVESDLSSIILDTINNIIETIVYKELQDNVKSPCNIIFELFDPTGLVSSNNYLPMSNLATSTEVNTFVDNIELMFNGPQHHK